MNLSKNEKVLLIILALLLINVVGLMYGVIPQINAAKKSYSNYKMLSSDYHSKVVFVEQKATLEASYNEKVKEYESASEKFYHFTSNEELDRFMDKLLGPSTNTYSAYFYVDVINQVNTESGEASEEITEFPFNTIILNSVSLEVEGSYEECMAVIERIQDSEDYMNLNNYSISKDSKKYFLEATVEIYSVN